MKQIDFFLNYPTSSTAGTSARSTRSTRSPAHGSGRRSRPALGARAAAIRPRRSRRSSGRLLAHKAKIIDGRHEIRAPGLIIHPAFRGHTYGSQLLQVNTSAGQLVFGSDTYSSWTGIRDWLVANIQQTDTIQQFLAYEKCYVLDVASPNSFNNCIAAHEPPRTPPRYPITANWWNIPDGNCSRAAELVLSNHEPTHLPSPPPRGACTSTIPAHSIPPGG